MHVEHCRPPEPQSLGLVPGWQTLLSQQPLGHATLSQTHCPLTQCVPFWLQLPVWHGLPQPSSAPHAFPAQFGVHTQLEPLQVSEPLHCMPDMQHA